ncbi:hypothetical protein FRB99_007497 [Tulasnella sp. 403]|nr:hypothetical protein FRB99_007497 [Tulasnella sp. 403]
MVSSTPYHPRYLNDNVLVDNINAASFSPDGHFLSVADSRGVLVTVNATSMTTVHVGYLPPPYQVFAIAWASESELFFGSSNGVVASVTFVPEGRAFPSRYIPYSFPSAVSSLATHRFSSTEFLVAIGYLNDVEIWRCVRGYWRYSHNCFVEGNAQPGDRVVSLAFLGTGDLVIGRKTGGISVWTKDATRTVRVPGLSPQRPLQSFALTPDGLILVAFHAGFTELYRITSQVPHGLVPVKNWPGKEWTEGPSTPIPIALDQNGTSQAIVCTPGLDRVTVATIQGLTKQFTPSLADQFEISVLFHAEGTLFSCTDFH